MTDKPQVKLIGTLVIPVVKSDTPVTDRLTELAKSELNVLIDPERHTFIYVPRNNVGSSFYVLLEFVKQ